MSDDDSSVGHPEQRPNGTSGNAIDAYFNLNPDKFHAMPTGEFLKLAKEYQEVSESYEKAKQTLLELDEKKKEIEDTARANTAVGVPTEPTDEQPIETHEEQPALEQAIHNQEEQAEKLAEPSEEEPAPTPSEDHHDDPIEAPGDHMDTPSEPHSETHAENNDHPDDGRPQISRAEINISGGPAL